MDKVKVASLSGPLDGASGEAMVASVKASVEKGSCLVLDCTMMSSMDVGGFRSLLALQRWSQGNGGRLVIAGMPPEAWKMVVDNNCESTFEAFPSAEAAYQSLGVQPQQPESNSDGLEAEPELEPDEWGAPPESASSVGVPPEPVAAYEPPAMTENPPASSWDLPVEPVGTVQNDAWGAEPLGGGSTDAWSAYQPNSETGGDAGTEKGTGVLSKYRWVWLGVGGMILLLCVLAMMGVFKSPEVTVSDNMVEVREGREPGEVTITVVNGVLTDRSMEEVPEGLWIDGPFEDGEKNVYHLAGEPVVGAADAEVKLIAERGSKKSEAVTLEIRIKPRPLEWLFQPPVMMVGHTIQGYTKIVSGARALVHPKWVSGDPGGIAVSEVIGSPGDWELTGNPVNPGEFEVEFSATDMTGQTEVRRWKLKVDGPPPPPVVKGLEWPVEFTKISLQQGQTVTGFSTIVSGAESATLKWKPNDPGGLTIEKSPGSTGWFLQGVPQLAGKFVLVATATASGSQPEIREIEIEISSADKFVTSGGDPAIGGEMRTFLLERIEKANDHFSEAEKESLRQMVTLLTDATLIGRFTFDTGKTVLSSREENRLRQAVRDVKNRELLDGSNCQILVVGYASPSGSKALNVRLSRERAAGVNRLLRELIGRGADLCGDYGPTDIVSEDKLGNQAVEVFAGTIDLPSILSDVADKFKDEFNRRHGG